MFFPIHSTQSTFFKTPLFIIAFTLIHALTLTRKRPIEKIITQEKNVDWYTQSFFAVFVFFTFVVRLFEFME